MNIQTGDYVSINRGAYLGRLGSVEEIERDEKDRAIATIDIGGEIARVPVTMLNKAREQ